MTTAVPQAVAKMDQHPEAIRLANIANEVHAACKVIEALPIETEADLALVTEGTIDAKKKLQELEQQRRAQTDPKLAEINVVRERYRPAEAAYKALAEACTNRLARHKRETAQAQHAQQEAAGQAFRAGDVAAGHAALAAVPAPAHTPGLAVKDVWEAEVINPGLVPYELCSPDPVKIRAHVRATNGAPIPGCRVFQVSQSRRTRG